MDSVIRSENIAYLMRKTCIVNFVHSQGWLGWLPKQDLVGGGVAVTALEVLLLSCLE